MRLFFSAVLAVDLLSSADNLPRARNVNKSEEQNRPVARSC